MDFPKQNQPKYSPNVLIIFYDSTIGKEPLLKAIEEYHATVIYDLKIMKSISIKIPENKANPIVINKTAICIPVCFELDLS